MPIIKVFYDPTTYVDGQCTQGEKFTFCAARQYLIVLVQENTLLMIVHPFLFKKAKHVSCQGGLQHLFETCC